MSLLNSSTPPDNQILPQSGDINERFNKLHQDYQRIKSQNAILKKAVIQEQQKVANLEKDLREAEQKLRHNTEETDILQFNNQRLTKRITVLQEELATKSKEGGWLFGGSRDNKKSEELDVIRQDLEEKILENAQLHVEKRDLEEDIKQSAQLHADQISVLKACVIAKQEEVDEAAAEVQKMTETLAQLRAEMERQNNYFKESEEKLGREVQQIIAEINQARKKHKHTILNPTAAPPSPLSIWRDNKHTRELIGTFKDLYYAVESHWDTQLDKITILRNLSPPEQLGLIYKEIAATIPSLSTQMTHISESLHQYLPVLFSKDALPNIEFADTLHRFVNTCKKWLSYQQLRHHELSQQGTGPHSQAHTALADVYVQVLRALDRLVADREVSAIRSLCGVLSVLVNSTRALYAQEATGLGEGGMGKNAGEGAGAEDAIIEVNERLLETQAKTVALLDKFAAKLDEYESLATSGRLLQEGEDSHRLREVASHLIMLNNDINVASKERELHHLSVQRESDSFKNKLKDLEDMLTKKDEELKEQITRWNVTKEQVGVVAQELENVRNEKLAQEKSFAEKQNQLIKEHEEKITKLEQEHTEKQNQLTKEHEEKLSQITKENEDKLSQITKEHEQKLRQMTKENEDKLGWITKEHEQKYNQLTKDYEEKVSQLTKENEEKLSQLTRESEEKLSKVTQEKDEQLSQLKKESEEKLSQLTQGHEQTLEAQRSQLESQKNHIEAQKAQVEADHAQILSASLARGQTDLDTLRQQLEEAKRTVEQLRHELNVQQKRAEDAENRARDEQQRFAAQSQDMNAQEGRAQEVQRSQAAEVQQLKTDVEARSKQVQELQDKVVQIEGTSRAEMAEKAQQVKVLQQKLMAQEQRLEERTKQVQAAERLVAEKEQQLAKLRENPQPAENGNSASEKELSAANLIDADITAPSESQAVPETPVAPLIDDTVPLTPTPTNNGPKYSMTVVDQSGNQSNGVNDSPADKERERALTEFYEGKMQNITAQAKASDAKAVQLFEQYSSLLKALEEKEAERNTLLDQIKIANQETKVSREDLESTRTNYDAQLRMLSDHIIELGEKIVQLEAEASAVKGCKVACGKCKTWNTVEWLMGEGRGGQRCVKGNHPLSTFMV